MKKIISTLLIVLVLFNFILCNDSYAIKVNSDDTIDKTMNYEKEQNVANGETSKGSIVWGTIGSVLGAIAGILAEIIDLYPKLIRLIMNTVVSDNSDYGFTMEKASFNEIEMFDVNYFDFSANGVIGTLRKSVAKWFYIVRLIAMALNLLVLLYVGIRMALSTIADDQAKYKKMLMGWLESMVILFLMQYILSFVMSLGNMFTQTMSDMASGLRGESFEEICLDTIYGPMDLASGWTFVMYSVVFWFLVSIQFKFFCNYFRRLLTVGFLIIIAPLVTVTYPIDKIGDGKAQAFSVMMMEFAVNIFIQPVHALIYMIFMFTAGEIAKESILLGLVFLLFLTKIEKLILHMFNLKNVVSLRPVEEEKGIS